LLDPRAIITYWQGPDGYSFEAVPSEEINELHNVQSFWFKDEFIVDVYLEKMIDGEWTMQKIHPDHLDVDRIVVKIKGEGPTDGTKQDPPWPPQSG
jgi:hypothetical protein